MSLFNINIIITLSALFENNLSKNVQGHGKGVYPLIYIPVGDQDSGSIVIQTILVFLFTEQNISISLRHFPQGVPINEKT